MSGRRDAPARPPAADPPAGADRAGVADPSALSCPLPLSEYPHVLLAHGGGGRLTQMLVEKLFLGAFGGDPRLERLHDGAVLGVGGARLAFTTDSFVVRPLFFPGGDIGSLAVHGTVNDLAMCGAEPLALSVGFILEEGFPMADLWRIARSVEAAARDAAVAIVTGDTKVVDRGKGDGVYLNTSGIGRIADGIDIAPRRARPGDRIVLSGDLAAHGIAILAVREGLELEPPPETDSACLWPLVAGVLERAGERVHVLRDPTRGGVASALNEIAAAAGVGMVLDEAAIPVREEVRGACELLGLDPLYVANEGKCLALVAADAAGDVLAAMRENPLGRDAAVIGEVVDDHPGRVLLESRIGGRRVVDMLSGEQLPRIC